MKMKLVKKTDGFYIFKRKDGRFAVLDNNKNPINAEEKIRLLVQEELVDNDLPQRDLPTTDQVDLADKGKDLTAEESEIEVTAEDIAEKDGEEACEDTEVVMPEDPRSDEK